MAALHTAVRVFVNICSVLTATLPSRSHLFATVALRLIWLTWMCAIVVIVIYLRTNGGDYSVSGLVGAALMVLQVCAYVVIIFEVALKRKHFAEIQRQLEEVDALFEQRLSVKMPRISIRHMLGVVVELGICLACDATSIWVNEWQYEVSPIFWYTISYIQGLRMRYIQITMHTLAAQHRANVLQQTLLRLAADSKETSYFDGIWRPYSSEEYDKLNAMRLIYGQIAEIYEHINAYYGWSIMLLFISSFIVFVCNAYWCFRVFYQHKPLIRLVHNSATVMATVVTVMCHFWYAEESDDTVSTRSSIWVA